MRAMRWILKKETHGSVLVAENGWRLKGRFVEVSLGSDVFAVDMDKVRKVSGTEEDEIQWHEAIRLSDGASAEVGYRVHTKDFVRARLT